MLSQCLTLMHGGSMMGAFTHLAGVVALAVLSVCAWLNPELDSPEYCSKEE